MQISSSRIKRIFLSSLLSLAIIIIPQISHALTVREVPNSRQINGGWVTDMANIISDNTETELNRIITELEAKNGTEIAVVTVPETAPSPTPKAFATELFNYWGIGKKGINNGVLFLVSVGDRRVEIETGYGVEGILPNARVGNIIETKITPRFKQQDFDGGILAGTKSLVAVLGDTGVVSLPPKKVVKLPPISNIPYWSELWYLICMSILLLLFVFLGRHMKKELMLDRATKSKENKPKRFQKGFHLDETVKVKKGIDLKPLGSSAIVVPTKKVFENGLIGALFASFLLFGPFFMRMAVSIIRLIAIPLGVNLPSDLITIVWLITSILLCIFFLINLFRQNLRNRNLKKNLDVYCWDCGSKMLKVKEEELPGKLNEHQLCAIEINSFQQYAYEFSHATYEGWQCPECSKENGELHIRIFAWDNNPVSLEPGDNEISYKEPGEGKIPLYGNKRTFYKCPIGNELTVTRGVKTLEPPTLSSFGKVPIKYQCQCCDYEEEKTEWSSSSDSSSSSSYRRTRGSYSEKTANIELKKNSKASKLKTSITPEKTTSSAEDKPKTFSRSFQLSSSPKESKKRINLKPFGSSAVVLPTKVTVMMSYFFWGLVGCFFIWFFVGRVSVSLAAVISALFYIFVLTMFIKQNQKNRSLIKNFDAYCYDCGSKMLPVKKEELAKKLNQDRKYAEKANELRLYGSPSHAIYEGWQCPECSKTNGELHLRAILWHQDTNIETRQHFQ